MKRTQLDVVEQDEQDFGIDLVQQEDFTPIELNPMDLLQEMNTEENDGEGKRKKRRKRKNNKQTKSETRNEEFDDSEHQQNQKAFFTVDKKTMEQINWKPPAKNWLKGFFSNTSEIPAMQCTTNNADNSIMATSSQDQQLETPQENDDSNDEYLDQLNDMDKEARAYLLNVRFEAQNYCEKTVVATNIDPRSYDNNRTDIKDIDLSIYNSIHQFDAFSTGDKRLNISKNYELNILQIFERERNSIQNELDKKLRMKIKVATAKKEINYPSLNSNYDDWKRYCLGEENVYELWERSYKKSIVGDENKKKKRNRRGRNRNKKDAHTETIEPESSIMEEDVIPTTTTVVSSTESVISDENKAPSTGHSPTVYILTSYLDYVTTHALLSKVIHWTVSNFHNNSLLRRGRPLSISEVDDEEDDEEEDKSGQSDKDKWIENYLLHNSVESNNLLRSSWIYYLLMAIDKPPNDTVGANMNQLLLWILGNFSLLTPQEQEEFKKIIVIIIKYFGQGNPNILNYQSDETTSIDTSQLKPIHGMVM